MGTAASFVSFATSPGSRRTPGAPVEPSGLYSYGLGRAALTAPSAL